MLIQKKGGFTLLEMVVAILIVAILAAMAFSYYERAIERMRISDVLALLGTELSAQERSLLTRHHYTKYWHLLDAVPVYVRTPSSDNAYANGSENTIFYTRGKDPDGQPRQGYKVYFEEIGGHWFITADRVGSDKYDYSIIQPFEDKMVYCVPHIQNDKNQTLCTDFMGVELPSELPPDPRTAFSL
ncbi:MAG: prepilin-type N-terminal cleavage/methylation domain-containing protein [Elusimicrobiaceae bacterium]|nr:prepilin-type N-terminal cleavage/methylation domain-containing protein [Elusimicrobiaceae bacterium]